MSKIKKSVTMSKDVARMVALISKELEIPENSVISVAVFEYFNKVKGSLLSFPTVN